MGKFSSFSSYSRNHGNYKDHTGCLIGSEDSKKLAQYGFVVGAPIGASGTISTDGEVDLVISDAKPAGVVHSYAADGSIWFSVAPNAIRLRSSDRFERQLKQTQDDVHVSKLVVQVRQGVIRLVSTGASRFGKTKKRNASARARHAHFDASPNPTEIASDPAAALDRPLVSFVKKMGDNYALLMSQDILNRVGLVEGSRVELEPTGDGRIIVTRSKRHFTLDELLAGMTPDREHPLEDDAPRGEEML